MLGNPPWERIWMKKREFFSIRNPEIAQETNSAFRKEMIKDLSKSSPMVYEEFLEFKIFFFTNEIFFI